LSDFITLLRPLGKRASKLVTPDQVHPAEKAVWHRGGEVHLAGPGRLFQVLERAAQDGNWIAVRGSIREGVDRERMVRRHVEGHEPSLEPAEHRWILLDLDKHRPTVDMREGSAEHWARLARADLPEPFRAASCWYQATGSARTKPGLRLRLAFWLSEPLSDASIKSWVATWPVTVDTALYTPSQPHYLAEPVYQGVPDPWAGESRSGVLEGASEVQLVDLQAKSAAEEALAKAQRACQRLKEGERRNGLNLHAFRLAAAFAEDELPGDRIKETLTEALIASGGTADYKAHVTLVQAIQDGRNKRTATRDGWRSGLALDADQRPKSTAANVSLYLTHHSAFEGRTAYDQRAGTVEWLEPPPWQDKGAEANVTYAVEWFQAQCGIDAKPSWVRAGLLKAAMERSFDPVIDYLSNLPEWDGENRAESLFIDQLGVEDTQLHRAQTRCWLIQTYRRAFATVDEPVKGDYVLVFTGKQGQRKSSLLSALCPMPRFFRDQLPPIGSKDALIALADSWIVELADFTQRKADQDAFKALITSRMDKIRRPYRADEELIPRRCSLCATVNGHTPLTDSTGNRRFWPMACTRKADDSAIVEMREQLWAEVKVWAEAGERAYLPDALEVQAEAAQEYFREEDPVELKVERALTEPTNTFDGTLWEAGQLDSERRIVQITILQLAELIRCAKTHWELRTVKDKARAMGWIERRIGRKNVLCAPEGWHTETRSLEVN